MTVEEKKAEYKISRVQIHDEAAPLLDEWKEWNSRFNDGSLFCDPDWLLENHKGQAEKLFVFFIRRGEELVGVIPFVFAHNFLNCQIGEITVFRVLLRRLNLQNAWPNIPREEAVYDLLFNEIVGLKNDFDAMFLEGIEIDSAIYGYLRGSKLIGKNFSVYEPEKHSIRPLIKIEGTFEGYMEKFSARARHKLNHEIKTLRKQGAVQVVKITRAEEVDAFVDSAAAISQKTYQYNLLGSGLREPEKLKRSLKFVADHGWLRSYLLKCNNDDCAFMIGYQDPQRYYHIDIGYDPAWRKFGVGKALNLFAVEDIFNHDTPRFFDYLCFADYKQSFSTEGHLQVNVYVFQRRLKLFMAQNLHRIFLMASNATVGTLNALNLKKKIKAAIRLLSVKRETAGKC